MEEDQFVDNFVNIEAVEDVVDDQPRPTADRISYGLGGVPGSVTGAGEDSRDSLDPLPLGLLVEHQDAGHIELDLPPSLSSSFWGFDNETGYDQPVAIEERRVVSFPLEEEDDEDDEEEEEAVERSGSHMLKPTPGKPRRKEKLPKDDGGAEEGGKVVPMTRRTGHRQKLEAFREFKKTGRRTSAPGGDDHDDQDDDSGRGGENGSGDEEAVAHEEEGNGIKKVFFWHIHACVILIPLSHTVPFEFSFFAEEGIKGQTKANF